MEVVTIAGIAASIFSAVSMIPQLIGLLKDKDASGISYFSLAILLIGLGGWVFYGVLKEDIILIVANGFAFLLNAVILIVSVKFGTNSGKKTSA